MRRFFKEWRRFFFYPIAYKVFYMKQIWNKNRRFVKKNPSFQIKQPPDEVLSTAIISIYIYIAMLYKVRYYRTSNTGWYSLISFALSTKQYRQLITHV